MRARLLCPELVTVQPVDRAGTRVDELAAEPYAHQARGTEVVISAQVDELDRQRRTPGQGGATAPSRVMLTVRIAGTRRADGSWTGIGDSGWEPAAGDRIARLANGRGGQARAVAWYVTEAHPIAKDGATPKLIQVMAEDRAPRRTAVEGL